MLIKITLILFFISLAVGVFCWIKLLFEINKIQKLEKLSDELKLFVTPFFLSKLLVAHNLATKNKKNLPVFLFFCKEYQELFHKEAVDFLSSFFQGLETDKSWNDFLVESEFQFNFFRKFDQFKKKVNHFSGKLMLFSAWENLCLEQINVFNLILAKINEDLDKIKIIFAFDFKEVDKNIMFLESTISHLRKTIYHQNIQITFSYFKNLGEKLLLFTEKYFDWYKLLNLYLVVLPKRVKEVISLAANLQFKVEKKNNVDFFLNKCDETKIKIKINLVEFNVEKVYYPLQNLILDLENRIFQLKEYEVMKTTFQSIFQFVIVHFEKIKKKFTSFGDKRFFSQSLEKVFFFHQLKVVKFQNFNDLLTETQKSVDDLLITHYNNNKISFFQPVIKQVQKILLNFLKLSEIYHQIDLFSAKKEEKSQIIFLTLLNFKTILDKKENFFLKTNYYWELNKLFDDFSYLIQKGVNSNHFHKKTNYNLVFNDFQNQVLNFKNKLENTFFLKHIAEILFVKVNRKRFVNEFLYNKILNCEVLFLKQNYKDAVELLLKILKSSN